jgi:peroxiredoxin
LLGDSSRDATEILAVSSDDHEDSKLLVQKLAAEGGGKVTFPLLEDQNSAVIKRYGLLNPQGKGWPQPATYVIDTQGIVRWKFIEVDYKVRPTNTMILDALQAIPST